MAMVSLHSVPGTTGANGNEGQFLLHSSANVQSSSNGLQASSDRDCSCCNCVWRIATAIACFVRDVFVWLFETLIYKAPEPSSIPSVQQDNDVPLERFKTQATSILNEHFRMDGLSGPLLPAAARVTNNQIGLFIGCKLGEEVLYYSQEAISPQKLETCRDIAIEAIGKAIRSSQEPATALLQITTLVGFEHNGKRQYGAKVSTHQRVGLNPSRETRGYNSEVTLERWRHFTSPYQMQQQS